MSWYLDSVYERNKESPYTFYAPSKEVIEMLNIGDIVKLIFVETDNDGYVGERMWVEINHMQGKNFKGILTNVPLNLKDLKNGQEIIFQTEHICDTEYEDPTSSEWDYYFNAKIIVSNDVLERNEFNFMLRDNPKDEQDSGWSVLSGYEDDEFLNNPDNLQYISIGEILNIDDSILSFIEAQPLCAYERNDEYLFYKIDDYDWDTYLNE
ncbi:DUF2185 domain-containing protein [Paenisporosarcina sp. OV554]|uniref:immunity protein Imm33 domain-containing protein n=1 Tax=Paenisporosarcina sp. OV554 TaxID=2135694 RepID=UPI000D372916|nr:DUF2185 domain-containing protein [Paenisporosarcina sp. OV554]PUB08157.1 hypothetical protein C8K15_1456 [Paenisporosarcina sp. OV554]